jgi:hypothetical protein
LEAVFSQNDAACVGNNDAGNNAMTILEDVTRRKLLAAGLVTSTAGMCGAFSRDPTIAKARMLKKSAPGFHRFKVVTLDENALVVNTGKNLVLFDTGVGTALRTVL